MASGVTILASASPGELRVAATRDGKLIDYAIERPGAPDFVGAVMRGRVTARMPSLAGSFVTLGPVGDGFLPDSAGGHDAAAGSIITVRVTRAAQGGKGVRLARLAGADAAGPLGVVKPGPDALDRLAALHSDAAVVVDDAALIVAKRISLGARLSLESNIFHDAVETEVEALASPVCDLPGSGRMTIEPTSALVAIDIDLGRGSSGKGRKTASHIAANTEFLPEIGRQIRVRNLSGPILVDLAGLSPRRRGELAPAVQAALADDPLQPRFLGFSALGLAEILRPRVHAPLHELLGTAHAAGMTALRRLAAECACNPAQRPTLTTGADVFDALTNDEAARSAFTRRCGRPLELQVDRSLPPKDWSIGPAC